MDKKICIQHCRGRLGNIMFAIASGMYFARQHDREFYCLYNPEDVEHYNNYYERELNYGIFHTLPVIYNLDQFDINKVKFLREVHATYTPMVDDGSEILFLDGWKLNPRYFTQEFACEIFGPDEDMIQYIYDLYPEISFEDCISINVRRGDYINYCTWGYVTNELPFYQKIFDMYPKNQKYVVSSDDIEWCKTIFTGDNFYFVDKQTFKYQKMWIDLYIPGLCKHNIISNSTFSWWGAYLNNHPDRKVYYQYPFYKNERNDGYTYDCILPDDPNWVPIYQKELTSVALCAMVKGENQYLREWVEYYRNMGISKIYLYDNNDFFGEDIRDVVGDYIDSGYIEVTDRKNMQMDVTTQPSLQVMAYQDNYERHGGEHDWICYFDVDEFLWMVDYDDIRDFINYQSKFSISDIICVNTMLYDDNGMIANDYRPVLERFTHACKALHNDDNNVIRSIVRGRQIAEKIKWTVGRNKYNPVNFEEAKQNICFDMDGNVIEKFGKLEDFEERSKLTRTDLPNYNRGYLKHFRTKTISEYCNNKIRKKFPNINTAPNLFKQIVLDKFFKYNEWTREKEEAGKKMLGWKYDDSKPEYVKSDKIAVCAVTRDDAMYIDEWLHHYRDGGVDKVFLYDCNDNDDIEMCKLFDKAVEPYILDDFVEVVDIRKFAGHPYLSTQAIAYNDCYKKHGDEYKWICFFDTDEFFCPMVGVDENPTGGISQVLSNPALDKYLILCVNCKFYNDSGHLRYSETSTMERFTCQLADKVFGCTIKSIVRGGNPMKINWLDVNEQYLPIQSIPDKEHLCGTLSGRDCEFLDFKNDFMKVDVYTLYTEPDYSAGCLKCYKQKTITEFLKYPYRNIYSYSGQALHDILNSRRSTYAHLLNTFFTYNMWTEQKQEIVDTFLRVNHIKLS